MVWTTGSPHTMRFIMFVCVSNAAKKHWKMVTHFSNWSNCDEFAEHLLELLNCSLLMSHVYICLLLLIFQCLFGERSLVRSQHTSSAMNECVAPCMRRHLPSIKRLFSFLSWALIILFSSCVCCFLKMVSIYRYIICCMYCIVFLCMCVLFFIWLKVMNCCCSCCVCVCVYIFVGCSVCLCFFKYFFFVVVVEYFVSVCVEKCAHTQAALISFRLFAFYLLLIGVMKMRFECSCVCFYCNYSSFKWFVFVSIFICFWWWQIAIEPFQWYEDLKPSRFLTLCILFCYSLFIISFSHFFCPFISTFIICFSFFFKFQQNTWKIQ